MLKAMKLIVSLAIFIAPATLSAAPADLAEAVAANGRSADNLKRDEKLKGD